jgi:hypothetical protein
LDSTVQIHVSFFLSVCYTINEVMAQMTLAQINRRIAALKTADAINAMEGVPVSQFAQVLSRSWAKGEITGTQMKQALWASHTKLAAQVQKHG